MKLNRLLVLGILLIGILGFVSGQFANTNQPYFGNTAGYGNNYQAYEPSFNSYYSSEQLNTYWPVLESMKNDQCEATSDFVVSIPPLGCEPAVVRSDLLEEQNVPVFCKLDAIKINPLIKVSSIKSISFKGEYPEDIAGISFHPARAAVNTYDTLLGNPLLNNIGYAVIVLKQRQNEDEMADTVKGNLTATIYYDAEQAFGVGDSEFYVPILDGDDWKANYPSYGFWQGRGFIRVTDINNGRARIALYTDEDTVFRTFDLQEGQTSSTMYFPGFYCRAGLNVRLNDVVGVDDEALISVDGQELWVREGSKFLNSRCRVREISPGVGGTGSVSVYCPGGSFDLVLQKSGALFSVDSVEKEVKVGDLMYTTPSDVKITGQAGKELKKGKYSFYLGYVGETPSNLKEGGSSFSVVIVSSDKIKQEDTTSVFNKVTELLGTGEDIKFADFVEKLNNQVRLSNKDGSLLLINHNGETFYSEEGSPIITYQGLSNRIENQELNSFSGNYFETAQSTLDELLENYPREERNLEKYGEQALWEAIEYSRMLNQSKIRADLLERFIELYPNSELINKAKYELNNQLYYDYDKANQVVYVNNQYHYVGLSKLKSVDKDDRNIDLRIGGSTIRKVGVGDRFDLTGSEEIGNEEYISIKDIMNDRVLLYYYRVKNNGEYYSASTKTLYINRSLSLGEEKAILEIKSINIKQAAYVSLRADVDNTKTGANFSFSIGIEKRNIKLNPEKTKEKIENLNKSIERWEDIVDSLGSLLKVWKGGCFAMSGVLMLKNFVAGIDGEAIARQEVMKSYRARCEKLVSEGKYSSNSQCYSALETEIEDDVEKYNQVLDSVNTEIQAIESKNIEGDSFDSSINSKASKQALESKMSSYINSDKINVSTPSNEEKEVLVSELSYSQLRDYYRLKRLEEAGVSEEVLETAKDSYYQDVRFSIQSSEDKAAIASISTPNDLDVVVLDSNQDTIRWTGKSLTKGQLEGYGVSEEDLNSIEVKEGDSIPVQMVYSGRKSHLVLLTNANGKMSVVKTYEFSNTGGWKVGDEAELEVQKNSVGFINLAQDCNNKYTNPQVKYYESGSNAKLPAIVPFDVQRGWYAKVPNSVGSVLTSSQKSYTDAGMVSYYYICNVGSDGVQGGSDDICQGFDINTQESVNQFCGLSSSEVNTLRSRAREAIRQAAQQYGNKQVRILGQSMSAAVTAGENLYECEDFMSPSDCRWLFNACDPVICPSSRCDFGGTWKVPNVVQSGIIGSIVLCLPNLKEGIAVPVCLTGIHAGLENFVSIMRSHRDCLQESLDSGRLVGMCDQIYSVYICDFFWRQISPLLDTLLPKAVELLYPGNQGVRGGGEYLTVQAAWDSLQQNVDYFKNEYAQTAFRAFNARSVSEVGGEFCKAFIGTSLPTSADFLDSLLAPESPEQFYAHFSEIEFSDASVPPTSQYKVYFHIYAGEDMGSQYLVYLKSPPSTGYYAANPTVTVDRGYIPKGDEADKSLDFTAPSGYKELCVSINGREECGFKQVSTSAALDYLQKKYTEDQAKQDDIKTEKECVSGSRSIYALATPNVRQGVEESISPAANLKGIVRVCATENPGMGVDEDRWNNVGYCGDESIRCWLDTDSVKDDVMQIARFENTTQEAQNILGGLDSPRLSDRDSAAKLDKLRQDIRDEKAKLGKRDDKGLDADLIKRLDEFISSQGFSNVDIAEALYLKISLYLEAALVNSNQKGDEAVQELVRQSIQEADKECTPETVDEDCGSGFVCDDGFCQFHIDMESEVAVEGEEVGGDGEAGEEGFDWNEFQGTTKEYNDYLSSITSVRDDCSVHLQDRDAKIFIKMSEECDDDFSSNWDSLRYYSDNKEQGRIKKEDIEKYSGNDETYYGYFLDKKKVPNSDSGVLVLVYKGDSFSRVWEGL